MLGIRIVYKGFQNGQGIVDSQQATLTLIQPKRSPAEVFSFSYHAMRPKIPCGSL